MTKHTAEPWSVGKPYAYGSDHAGKRAILSENACVALLQAHNDRYINHEANAARIVACVNACAGMEDPAAALEVARATLRKAQERADDNGAWWIADDLSKALRALGG